MSVPFVSIDFNSELVQVIACNSDDTVSMRVVSGELIRRNQAVTVERDIVMSPLTDKDKKAMKIGRDMTSGWRYTMPIKKNGCVA